MGRDILLGVETHADGPAIVDALTTKEGPVVVLDIRLGRRTGGWERGAVRIPRRAGAAADARRSDRAERGAWTCLRDFPSWEGTTVTWSLSPEEEHGGTKVLLRHAGFPEEQPEWEFASIAYTWAGILSRLKVLAETGSAEPYLG